MSKGTETKIASHFQITPNEYQVRLFLNQPLDFESRSAYIISLEATDASDRPLRALASVAASIWDVQDQPPAFVNAPFSATVPENTPPVSVTNTSKTIPHLIISWTSCNSSVKFCFRVQV